MLVFFFRKTLSWLRKFNHRPLLYIMVKASETITPNQLSVAVNHRLPRNVKKRIIKEIDISHSDLRASQRGRKFVERMMEATLYKDMNGISYDRLKNLVDPFLPMAKRSLEKNVQSIRLALRRWSASILTPVNLNILERRASKQREVNSFKKPNIWADTTEFRMTGKVSTSTKDASYSYKVRGPGRKWLFLHDAAGRVIYCGGPRSPKTFDGDFFLLHLREVEQTFPGATIIADNHFRKAEKEAVKVTLLTPISRAGRPRLVASKKQKRNLTDEQERWNSDVSKIRGRVEAPYGEWQQRFQALQGPFGEGEDQLDCLVRTAAAVHRLSKA